MKQALQRLFASSKQTVETETSHTKWLIFGLMAMAQFMVVLDVVVANVALPIIKHSLHFSNSSLQWVVTAYALAFGGFLLLGGRAADLFGRRRMILIGMISFATLSLLLGLAQNELQLITLRTLQGASAALMSPAALSIVLTTFRDEGERNKALSRWTIIAAGGGAVGLLLGGILTQFLNWRWNFFINVPIGILVALGVYKFVPKHESESTHRHLDLPGAALVTSGLIAFVYAMTQAPQKGWLSGATLGVVGLSAALLTAFVYNESRSPHPLVPLSLFKVRNVTGANLIMGPTFAGVFGMFFLTALYLQVVLQYSPIKIGLSFLPFPLIIGFLSLRMPKLIARFGYKRFLVLGLMLAAMGTAWLVRLPVHGTYLIDVLPTIILQPLGMGMIFTPLFAAATTGVLPTQAGLASGLISTSQQMGGAAGLAIITGVASSVTTHTTNLTGAAALVHGYNRAFLVAVLFILVALALSVFIIQERPRAAVAEPAATH